MSPVVIRRICDVFIGLLLLGPLLVVLRGVLAVLNGDFGKLDWAVSTASPAVTELGSSGFIEWSHGTIRILNTPLGGAMELLFYFASAALLLIALLSLRGLLVRFMAGEQFVLANVTSLRRIGWALLAVCAMSLAEVLMSQAMILDMATMPAGMELHPAISFNSSNVENVWLEYDVPVLLFSLGGLALIFAEAFRSGMAFRQDSESVI